MRQNTARLYAKIREQFKTLTDQGMNATDAKHHLAGLWFKNAPSIERILRTKIVVLTAVENPAQIGLFDKLETKEVENG